MSCMAIIKHTKMNCATPHIVFIHKCLTCLSMVCPTLHSWGGCQSTPLFMVGEKRQICCQNIPQAVRDCPKPLKWHTHSVFFHLSLENSL